MQPLVLPDGRVIVGGGNKGTGIRGARRSGREGDKWTATEVVEDDQVHADLQRRRSRRMSTCTDWTPGGSRVSIWKNGAILWKEGDYGSGQLLLVGDKLLVISKTGKQLACVAAKSDEFEELWKMDIAKGKAWNHLAIARGRLYFRNATVMVGLDLPNYSRQVVAVANPTSEWIVLLLGNLNSEAGPMNDDDFCTRLKSANFAREDWTHEAHVSHGVAVSDAN